jgi:hypothetical protein
MAAEKNKAIIKAVNSGIEANSAELNLDPKIKLIYKISKPPPITTSPNPFSLSSNV